MMDSLTGIEPMGFIILSIIIALLVQDHWKEDHKDKVVGLDKNLFVQEIQMTPLILMIQENWNFQQKKSQTPLPPFLHYRTIYFETFLQDICCDIHNKNHWHSFPLSDVMSEGNKW